MDLSRFLRIALVGGAIGITVSIFVHRAPDLLFLGGPVGFAVSLLCGGVYGFGAERYGHAALGGGLAGLCTAFLGVLGGFLLGDQPALVLLFGTLGGTIAGVLGGLAGRSVNRER